MKRSIHLFACLWLFLLVGCPAAHAAGRNGSLVDVAWLKEALAGESVLLIDASAAKLHTARHIPGAVGVDLYRYGAPFKATPQQMEQRIQSWGVGAGKTVVVYDEGGGQGATWLFYTLYYHGFPLERLVLLDGGLAKWQASGGATSSEPTAKPAAGDFRVATREEVRVRLPEFLTASGDPARHVLVEALETSHHFGEQKFFDRPGHIPRAVSMPSGDFYNADKTFKSPAEIRRLASYFGITDDHEVLSHCGGGVAATVPFFAMKLIAGHPKVKVYMESQLEWLQDERGLPFWTYDAPFLMRDPGWLNTWGGRMMRAFDISQVSVVDVRTAEAYGLGHVPFALSVPAETFRGGLEDAARLAASLERAGVNPQHEAVIVSERGLDERSALAFLLLEKMGQKRVSVLMDSVDEWGLRGYPLAKEPTTVGPRKSPQDMAVPAVAYAVGARPGVVAAAGAAAAGAFPRVYVATGKRAVTRGDAKVIHLPYTELLDAKGAPKPAHEIWNAMAKAGVPRYAEIVTVDEEPGAAAMGYFLFRLMGFPDVKVAWG